MFQSAARVVEALAGLGTGHRLLQRPVSGRNWRGGPGSRRLAVSRQAVSRDGWSTAEDEKTVARRCRHCTGLKVLANPKVHPVKEKLSVALNGREVQTEMLLIS
jgi:hypothetical protein